MGALTNLKAAATEVGVKAIITNSDESLETQIRRLTKQEDLPIMLVSWDLDVGLKFNINGFLDNPTISVVCLLLTKPEDLTKGAAEDAASEMGTLYTTFIKKLYEYQAPIAKDPEKIITDATYKLVPWHSISKHSGCLGRFKMIDEVSNCDSSVVTHRLQIESATPDLGTTSPSPGTYTYKEGRVETIHPVPFEGFEFVEWQDQNGNVIPGQDVSINFDGNYVARAFFKQLLTLTNQLINGYGEVFPNSGIYSNDTEIELVCLVDERFEFKEWNVNGVIYIDNPQLITITEDVVVKAELTPKAEFLQFPNNTLNLTESLNLNKIL